MNTHSYMYTPMIYILTCAYICTLAHSHLCTCTHPGHVCSYTLTYTPTHIYTHIPHTCLQTLAHTLSHMYTALYTHIVTLMHIPTYVYTHTQTCAHTPVCIHIHNSYIYMPSLVHTHPRMCTHASHSCTHMHVYAHLHKTRFSQLYCITCYNDVTGMSVVKEEKKIQLELLLLLPVPGGWFSPWGMCPHLGAYCFRACNTEYVWGFYETPGVPK